MASASAGAKKIDASLRAHLWRPLRDAGFEVKGRTAWRARDGIVHVIALRALGGYVGPSSGATPATIHAEAGLFFAAAHEPPWEPDPLPFDPKHGTSSCDARLVLAAPPARRHPDAARSRPDAWHVDERTEPDALAADAWRAVAESALPWLARHGEPEQALDAFERHRDAELEGGSGILGESFGGELDSLARCRVICALCRVRREPERARRAIERALVAYAGRAEAEAELRRWARVLRVCRKNL